MEYLIAVFTDVLHSQRDPLALCLMFQLYDKELHFVCPQLCEFNQYYCLWIPKQAREALVSKTTRTPHSKIKYNLILIHISI